MRQNVVHDSTNVSEARRVSSPQGFLTLLLLISSLTLSVGCSSSSMPRGELVMFTSFGPHAFEGKVLVMRPDGTGLTTLLNPQPLLGYEAAYGNSLKAFVVISVAQSTGGNNSVVTLSQYMLRNRTTVPLQSQLPAGGEGVGVPSPDNSQFVATISPPGQPQIINLWISDFRTKQFRQLTQGSAQDVDPVWSPNGQQIAFIRLTPPITTELMTVPVQGGPATVLLGPSEHVGDTAYSRDGKQLAFTSINGLELINLSTMQRTVIVPPDRLNGNPVQRATVQFGISWARTQDKIILIMRDLSTDRDQLWVVSSDGSDVHSIFTADAGSRILSVTFVDN